MTRPSKTTISALLDEYARLELRRLAIEVKRDAELAPFKEAYEKKAGPVLAEAQARLRPIQERLQILAGDINAQMMAGVDEKAETIAIPEVAVEIETTRAIAAAVVKLNQAEGEPLRMSESNKPLVRAVAQVDSKPGSRQVDAQTFFANVPESERNDTFWKKCLKVLVGEADKFLGKEKVDKLAKAPKSFSVSISLKP